MTPPALIDILAADVEAQKFDCPILQALHIGHAGLSIGATTASLDAALARRMPAGLARRGTWPLTADTESL